MKMEDYDSGDDLFTTQNTFHSEEELNTQDAIDAADSSSLGENDIPGESVDLLDFSNLKDNLSFVSDYEDDMTGFPEVSILC